MSVSAADIPDKNFLQTVGDRRSIRYYDPERKVEDWKIQTMLQAGRLASCQGNINATEAIVVEKETCDLWDEIEECVSGFNVQIINQSSHLIFWLTNLNAWYGRANDGISTVALAGGMSNYHGWNYEFTMTQTVPRLMSFPTERTEILLRFETGQAVAQAMLAGVGEVFGLPPHYRFTWAHAVGYALEDPRTGGQRPRLRYERLFHRNAFGTPMQPDPEVDEALREKGLLQEQGPLPGRFEELDALADRFGRERGVIAWPEREIRRLMSDPDWDFGPRIRQRAEEVIAQGDLPDYPEEMRETFRRLMEEHGIDASKYLS
jgi:hypothetical protein